MWFMLMIFKRILFLSHFYQWLYKILLCLFAKKQIRGLESIQTFKNEVENKFSKNMKVVISDRRGKYDSSFNEFCSEHGLIHQTEAPYTL